MLPDKATRTEMVERGGQIVRFAKTLFRLAAATEENTKAIAELRAENAALKDQVRDLAAREEVLLAKAETAATRAAAQTTTELARRIGRIDGRNERD